jgi:hypothetical protein
MYWLLLPVDANAGRHFVDEARPSGRFWSHLWAKVLHVFGSRH